MTISRCSTRPRPSSSTRKRNSRLSGRSATMTCSPTPTVKTTTGLAFTLRARTQKSRTGRPRRTSTPPAKSTPRSSSSGALRRRPSRQSRRTSMPCSTLSASCSTTMPSLVLKSRPSPTGTHRSSMTLSHKTMSSTLPLSEIRRQQPVLTLPLSGLPALLQARLRSTVESRVTQARLG